MPAHHWVAFLALALLAHHGCCQQCTVKQNCTIAAPDMISYALYAATESQCCAECASFSGCLAAIFDAGNNACHLKNTTEAILLPGKNVVFVDPKTTPAPLTAAPATPVPWTPSPSPNVLPGNLIWNVSLGDSQVVAGPFVSDGIVLALVQNILTGAQYYQTIDSSSGQLLWRYEVLAIPTLLLGNGLVYFISLTNVVALNANTGLTTWEVDVLVSSEVDPVLTNGALYLFNDATGEIIALSATTGQVIWGTFIPDYSGGQGKITIEGDLTYVAMMNPGKVVCLETSTGFPIWNVSLEGSLSSAFVQPSIVLVDYYYTGANELVALNSRTGTGMWQASVNRMQLLDVLNDTVYFQETADSTPYLVARSALTGEPLWATLTDASAGNPKMKAVDGVIYLWSSGWGGVAALKASNGEILWSHNNYYVEHLHFSNGTLYLTSLCSVAAANATDGSVVWTWQAQNCISSVLSNETVYAASGETIAAWQLQ